MNTTSKLALAALISLFSTSTFAATVTMTVTPNVTRTQIQGAGNYNVYDFFWTNAPGAQFTNYTVTGSVTNGSFFDPARLQDDRQINPPAAGQDGNTAGAVDMWANTIWSSAGKTDLGLLATILSDPSGYAPTGSGAAPAFTNFKWDVFDNVLGDDNNLSDDPDNPTTAAAPYHFMRVVTSLVAGGTVYFQAYDTSRPGVPYEFNFILCCGPGLEVDDLDLGDVTRGTVVTATLPGGISAPEWTLESFTGPNGPVTGASVDFNSGEFSWNSSGAALGGYSAVIRDTHFEAGSDTGTLTFNLIPEPSAATLCGLAMFTAMFGIPRRHGKPRKVD